MEQPSHIDCFTHGRWGHHFPTPIIIIIIIVLHFRADELPMLCTPLLSHASGHKLNSLNLFSMLDVCDVAVLI
ncbi:hypothetical protein FEC30_19045 [Acinetobacter baumannii]|nr:hypothetical protein FEC30_19045 [Acinetobacter baumannii]